MTPRIYFAGVNTTHFCEAFIGHHVLESFAYTPFKRIERYRPLFASVVLDSGAYSELTSGKAIDLIEYGDFIAKHGDTYEWVASLDSIDGGVDVNISNYEAMKHRGLDVVPTFHQGEPWSLLADYCKEGKRVGLGFQRPISEPRKYLDKAFEIIPSNVPVHGWAMTNYTDYPFDSVDSKTWIHEYLALMSVEGQGADVINCLTASELLSLVQRKYERQPKRQVRIPASSQLSLLGADDAA